MLPIVGMMHVWKCLGCTVTLLLEDSIQNAICPKCNEKMSMFRWFGIGSLILSRMSSFIMSTWNCKKCDMPITTMNPGNAINCPHCGKAMFCISEWMFVWFLFDRIIIVHSHNWIIMTMMSQRVWRCVMCELVLFLDSRISISICPTCKILMNRH